MNKTIIISSRLPFIINKKENSFVLEAHVGGLETTLGNIYLKQKCLWVGWPGYIPENEEERQQLERMLSEKNLVPVWMSREQVRNFYDGFCNQVIRPVFHYKPQSARFKTKYFKAYTDIQISFVEAIMSCHENNDKIWIHDFHLIPLASFLNHGRISYYHHIHFPNPEVLSIIPWCKSLLEMMMNGHLLCFQTYKDALNFKLSCVQLTDAIMIDNNLVFNQTIIPVEIASLSIDSIHYEKIARNITYLKEKNIIDILCVDRLDDSKGLIERLDIFKHFLELNPEFSDKVRLTMIIAPSKGDLETYKKFKAKVDKKINAINTHWRKGERELVVCHYKIFSQEELVDYYVKADICWVSSLRDGYNIVSKEFIATRYFNTGKLLLSKFSGVAQELQQAEIYHPFDINEGAHALLKLILMKPEEERKKMVEMRKHVMKYSVYDWMRKINMLESTVQNKQNIYKTNYLATMNLVKSFVEKDKRILILDLDSGLKGDIWDYSNDLEFSFPKLLSDLSLLPNTEIFLISYESQEKMHEWFGFIPIHIAANGGRKYKKPNQQWISQFDISNDNADKLYSFCEIFQNITKEAVIIHNEYSVTIDLANVPSQIIKKHVKPFLEQLNYFILENKLPFYTSYNSKKIEVLPQNTSKITFLERHLDIGSTSFVLCGSDNVSATELFRVLPAGTETISVNNPNETEAKYSIDSYNAFFYLLNYLYEQAIFNYGYGKGINENKNYKTK